ncbi:MAG: hypothetical protein F2520_09895 [Actinobacteria bacterium]|uniref:Unannotated protein n=1 Tax=freshwater metagenome TaxID=449393 RepID=A0A6J5YDC6_9ZZZZ|nr:hypothetical protein [Actinomycetota bacterium]
MRILITNNRLDQRAGSESYVETVMGALRDLGHEVIAFSPGLGEVASSLRSRGFEVHDNVTHLPDGIDVIHGQHVNAVAEVRRVLPSVPLVFVAHSWFIPNEDPCAELAPAALVALNERVQNRLRSIAFPSPIPIHRLRQPVEIGFFDGIRRVPSDRPESALLVSRKITGRLKSIQEACERAGIELRTLRGESADPRLEMAAADMVLASGRSALEAMSMARPTLLIDQTVCAGWITEDSWERIENEGFGTGNPTDSVTDLDALLAMYSPDFGIQARILAAHQHAAQDHASALIAIYRSIADTRSTEVLDQRLPALMKQNWAQTHKLQMLRRSNADLRAENWALQRELDRIGQSVPPGPTGVRSGSDRPRSGFWFRIETSGAALRVIAILLALRDALKSIRRE